MTLSLLTSTQSNILSGTKNSSQNAAPSKNQVARIKLVAPSRESVPISMRKIISNSPKYMKTIIEIQKFRDEIYFNDNAIPALGKNEESSHYSGVDYNAWHFIVYDYSEEIIGTFRVPIYHISENIRELMVYTLIRRASVEVQMNLLEACCEFISDSQSHYHLIAEPGGWAISEKARNNLIGAKLAAGSMALMQLLGNTACISTVTVKHKASLLARSIAESKNDLWDGSQWVYDSYHKCNLDVFFYYSDCVTRIFSPIVRKMKEEVKSVEVLTN